MTDAIEAAAEACFCMQWHDADREHALREWANLSASGRRQWERKAIAAVVAFLRARADEDPPAGVRDYKRLMLWEADRLSPPPQDR